MRGPSSSDRSTCNTTRPEFGLFVILLTTRTTCFIECHTTSARQSPENIWQTLYRVWLSAKRHWWTIHRQRLLCRVLFVEHSAKSLPSAIWCSSKKSHCDGDKWWRRRLCRVYHWHSTKAPSLLNVCWPGTRQRRLQWAPFASPFVKSSDRHSTKRASLSSVWTPTLGKEALPVPKCAFFAECYSYSTRQRVSLPSVTLGKVTRKTHFLFVFLSHPNKKKIYIIDITYIT